MASKKITITVPVDVAAVLEQWRATGRIDSVSGYISESVQTRIDQDESVAQIEEAFGGRPPLDMINRARALQGLPPLSAEDTEGRHAGAA